MQKVLIVFLCMVLLLAGCDQSNPTIETLPPPATEQTSSAVEVNKELLAVAVPASTEVYTLEDGTEVFSRTTQHMELIHPDEDVADKVILDFLNRVDAAQHDAEQILTSAQQDYEPDSVWFPYFHQMIYSPTRIDRGVLSLFGTQNSYSGGLHGSLSGISINYDLMTGDILTLGSIMHMDADKEDFIGIILEKLAAVAEDYYLFEDYDEGVRTRLDVDENLYEDFFFTNTGLAFFFSPYEIAPYSSGMITVEIPYSELPGLIYDGYFPDEREQISGSMLTGTFLETDMEQFDNMAELTLTTGQEIMVAYPQGTVEDIRITIPGNGMNLPDYTAFAAFSMTDKDAVVISVSSEGLNGITISYTSNSKIKTIPLN